MASDIGIAPPLPANKSLRDKAGGFCILVVRTSIHGYLRKKNHIMHTAVKMPLRSLNPTTVRELQQKYPNGEMQVLVENKPAAASEMNEDRFWEIIEKLDWNKENANDILAPAAEALSQYSEQDIRQFSEILARKLYNLDGERFARELDPEDAYSEGLFMKKSCETLLKCRRDMISNLCCISQIIPGN